MDYNDYNLKEGMVAYMENKQIVFTKINTAELLDSDYREPGPHEIAVRTEISSVSCGTERANLTGDPNISINSDENCEVVFPRYSGYSSSGTVIAKGSEVTDFEIGDTVAMSWTFHKQINVIDENNAVKFDASKVSMQSAALCHIGTFPIAALRKTNLEIGESMLVMGLGILGLMAVQFSKAAGAVPVVAVDPDESRRKKALEFGADFALDPFEDGFADKVKELTDGGVNAAIEVTGLGAGLNQCLDCMAKFGRIALLGCTRDKNFTVDYYRKVHGPGIHLIGAHTNARPVNESSHGYFSQKDDIKSILKLCELKRIKLEEMIDEVNSPKDCTMVYDRLANDREFPVVVQFDWSKF